MNCIGCSYNLLKDGCFNCTYEEGECVKISMIEKENAKLKTKYSHDCPNCTAFGKHCPHKVNGDPYLYDCYLTVVELEKENAELKTEKIPQLERKIASIRGAHSVDCKKLNARLEQVERLKKENAELEESNKEWQRTCVAKSNTNSQLTEQLADKVEQLTKAKKIIRSLLYVYQLGKNELATARIMAEAEQFLKEVSND